MGHWSSTRFLYSYKLKISLNTINFLENFILIYSTSSKYTSRSCAPLSRCACVPKTASASMPVARLPKPRWRVIAMLEVNNNDKLIVYIYNMEIYLNNLD
jgi:hypothetical protein